MRFGLEHPNAYRLVFCSTPGQISAIRHQVAADLGERCYDRFMRAVAEIAAEGRLRVGDADSRRPDALGRLPRPGRAAHQPEARAAPTKRA